jgi:hypothetical protein
VEREVTSEKLVVDMRRPNRRTPMKSRKAKTDCFRWAVWRRWCTENMVGARGENLDTHVAEDAPVCGNVAEDSPLAEIFHENPLINDEDDECESPYYHTCTMHILLEKYFIVHVMVCMYIIILTVLYTISFRTCEFGTTMADACSQKRGPHSAIIFVWTELYACMTVKN